MPAFVDASILVAIVLGEPGAPSLRRLVARQDSLFASELLAAEFLAAAKREGIQAEEAGAVLAPLRWVFPARSLRREVERVLAAGYLRGADVWHLACACYLAPDPSELAFLTRDKAQRRVAAELGFPTP